MAWNTLDGTAARIIAHRGASGLLPEHTLAAYALGLGQGADVIEPDLLPTADGALIARHEAELHPATDILERDLFRDRWIRSNCSSTVLQLSEIQQLRARQPFPGRDPSHDGRYPVPSWLQVLEWAAGAARERAQPVRLYPELKQPTRFAELGLDPVALFVESVRAHPEGVEIAVQCFEAQPLRRVHQATGLPCSLLLDHDADWRAAIQQHGPWLHALGVDKRLLWEAPGQPSGLVEAAHLAGLRVHPWTFRDDRVGEGFVDVREELRAALRQGVDGVFCDFPDTGIEVRRELAAAFA